MGGHAHKERQLLASHPRSTGAPLQPSSTTYLERRATHGPISGAGLPVPQRSDVFHPEHLRQHPAASGCDSDSDGDGLMPIGLRSWRAFLANGSRRVRVKYPSPDGQADSAAHAKVGIPDVPSGAYFERGGREADFGADRGAKSNPGFLGPRLPTILPALLKSQIYSMYSARAVSRVRRASSTVS